MVLILSDDDIASVLDLNSLLGEIADAFRKQEAGSVERPDRPHFPVGNELAPESAEPSGTGLVMPAYIHGTDYYATKLVSVHEDNAQRGLPTITAQIVLTDAATGQPAAYMSGTRITNARTACIGGLAARELATEPVTLGLIGAGTQARWQAQAIAVTTDVRAIRIYSPSDSRHDCANDLASLAPTVEPVDTPEAAVSDATVVVTATTSTQPVFSGDELSPGTLVVAIGAYTEEMQEVDVTTVERATQVFADVPEEVATIGDIHATDITQDALVPFSSVLAGDTGDARRNADDILLFESVGSAVLDATGATHLFETAVEKGVGTTVDL
jgi:alanine dehydrogenase